MKREKLHLKNSGIYSKLEGSLHVAKSKNTAKYFPHRKTDFTDKKDAKMQVQTALQSSRKFQFALTS